MRKARGDIVIEYAPSGAELLALSGNISIARSSGYVAATTMGGDIVIDRLEAGAHLQTTRGSVKIRLAKASSPEPRVLDITVSEGDVTLILAEPASATFDVELEYPYYLRTFYSIKSDFPLTVTASGKERDLEHIFRGKERVNATGAIGGGVDRIRLRIEKGNVYFSTSPERFQRLPPVQLQFQTGTRSGQFSVPPPVNKPLVRPRIAE